MQTYYKQFTNNNRRVLELNFLSRLAKYDCFPKVVSHTDFSITTEYCGEQISIENLPENWREQFKKILKILREERIYHNDMVRENITVLNGRIYLIDFEKASESKPAFPYFNIRAMDVNPKTSFKHLFELTQFKTKIKIRNELGTRKSKTTSKG